MTAALQPGSIAWMRAWHGDLIKRGNQVRARGRRAVVLSTRDGLVYVQEFTTGQRVGVRPHEIGPA